MLDAGEDSKKHFCHPKEWVEIVEGTEAKL